jgi:nicotinate-nucleotide pyrophosphorylase (carboxylating)
MNLDLDDLIERAIKEDMPQGDATTEALGLKEKIGRARLIAKEDLVLSGTDVFQKVMQRLDPKVEIKWIFNDGAFVLRGQSVASLYGNLVQILKAERIALNFLGRLSGIATLTRCFVKEIEHTRCQLLDTRKTTPLYRALEKRAVVHGGGHNHRMNLSDAILIKENHQAMAGGLKTAVEKTRKTTKAAIEIEVRSLDEVKEAVNLGVERILLDNMNDETLAMAVKLVPSSIKTEASGNMTLDRVKRVAETGVDFISVGALTHSAPCADLSLLFDDLKT